MRPCPSVFPLALAVAAPALADVSFHAFGTIPGYGAPLAAAVSADGSTVVGRVFASEGPDRGFRWTSGGGFQIIDLAVGASTQVEGVSADGSVLVGTTGLGHGRAFRWTQQGGAQFLNPLPGDSDAYGMGSSADGTVIVGASSLGFRGSRAVIWTGAAEPEDLGTLGGIQAYPWGISGDGTTIVGWSQVLDFLGSHAFRWTRVGGMQDLGVLASDTGSSAFDVNHDASIVVGDASFNGFTSVPFLWTSAQGMRSLGVPAGWQEAHARAVSRDGSVVAGYADTDYAEYRASIWTAETGNVDLNLYLEARGIDLEGWTLRFVEDVSADGTVLVGQGRHNGVTESWIVVIPAPPSALILALMGVGAPRRRPRSRV